MIASAGMVLAGLPGPRASHQQGVNLWLRVDTCHARPVIGRDCHVLKHGCEWAINILIGVDAEPRQSTFGLLAFSDMESPCRG